MSGTPTPPRSGLTAPRIQPRIEVERAVASRLEAPEATDLLAAPERDPSSWRMPALVLSGFGVLALGLAGLQTGNFVAAEFARSWLLGGLTLSVAVLGFGLILLGIATELRGLLRLRGVDRLRRDLAGDDATARLHAARRWLGGIEGGDALLPPLAAAP